VFNYLLARSADETIRPQPLIKGAPECLTLSI
jgi:hypothetical protein